MRLAAYAEASKRAGLGNWFTDVWDAITSGSVYSAATGNESPDQVSQLQQQERQNLVTAGMDPAVAAYYGQSDPNLVLSTFTGSGGPFGLVNWTGALPGGTNWVTQVESNVANSAFGQGQWLWWALGGIGALWLLTKAEK